MTATANMPEHSVDGREQSRPAPQAGGVVHDGRIGHHGQIGNAALAAIFDTLRDETTHCAPAALSVQREPGPNPQQVAAAAEQAKLSDDVASFLNLIRLLPVTGAFGLVAFMLQRAARAGLPVGVDSQGNPVIAHVIPGQIADVAMVVAGVHGSEQSGVEVAERLLKQLETQQPHFTVVIVPQLFPGNVKSRAAWEEALAKRQSNIAVSQYRELRDKAGDVGRTTKGGVDPNRQFPDLGKDLDLSKPVDSKGRLIEPSNLALLGLINAFKPSRLVSIHAVKNFTDAGIFADPHPSVKANANDPKAKEADELALAMAKKAKTLGAGVRGNERRGAWTSLYPGQDPTMSAEQIKKENAVGRSLGQWGPSRGITVITMEVGEQHRSDSAVKDPNRAVELEAEATAIREIFLGPPVAAPSTGPAGQAPTPVPAPVPAPVQRMLVASVAHSAGNQAAASLVRRLVH